MDPGILPRNIIVKDDPNAPSPPPPQDPQDPQDPQGQGSSTDRNNAPLPADYPLGPLPPLVTFFSLKNVF